MQSPLVAHATSSDVIEYLGQVKPNISGAYCYTEFWTGSYVIQSGDKLVYDEYVTGPQYMSGIDGHLADGENLRDLGLVDQNGIGFHPDQSTYPDSAYQWYDRTFSLTSVAGKTLVNLDLVFQGTQAGYYKTYFKNIYIENASDVKTLNVFDGTQNYTNLSYCSAPSAGGNGYDDVKEAQVSLSPSTAFGYDTVLEGPLNLVLNSFQQDTSAITLTGKPILTYGTFGNWVVRDATGLNDGWNVVVSASQVTENTPTGGFANGTSAITFPENSISLTGARSITANSGAQSINATGGPLILNSDGPIDNSTGVLLVKAGLGYGSGEYTVHEPNEGVSVTVPANQKVIDSTNYPSQATPYHFTVFFTISSGP